MLHYGKITTAINPALYLPSTFMSVKPRIGLWLLDGQRPSKMRLPCGFAATHGIFLQL